MKKAAKIMISLPAKKRLVSITIPIQIFTKNTLIIHPFFANIAIALHEGGTMIKLKTLLGGGFLPGTAGTSKTTAKQTKTLFYF
jgi:hypothetical protein